MLVAQMSASSFFLMIRPPPRSPLFPYTTLFRSDAGHPPNTPVRPKGAPATPPTSAAAPGDRPRTRAPGYRERFPSLAEADLAHAVLEVIRAAEDLDLDAHEVDRQVAPVNLRKAYSVLLGGDNHLGLAFLAAVDGFQNIHLRKPMVIHKPLGKDQFRAQPDEAVLEAARLLNAAEGRDLAPFQQLKADPLAGEHIFQVQRVMNAFA